MAKPRPYNDRRRVRHRTSAPVKKTARHRPTHAPKADDRPGFATGVIRRRGTHTQAAGIGSDGEARPCRRTTRSDGAWPRGTPSDADPAPVPSAAVKTPPPYGGAPTQTGRRRGEMRD